MAKLVELATSELWSHEPCYYLSEMNRMGPDSKGLRRYQAPPKTEIKPKDWNKIFWDNVEEKNKWKRGQSTFGPLFKKERT